MNGSGSDAAAATISSRPTTATVRGVRMPCASRAAYWATLLISSCRARLPLSTRRSWRSSHASTAAAYSGPNRWSRVWDEALIRL